MRAFFSSLPFSGLETPADITFRHVNAEATRGVEYAQPEACFITHRDAERCTQALLADSPLSPQGPQLSPHLRFPVRSESGSQRIWRGQWRP
ncbi:MAG: hypothetical protein IPK79_08810 [Vampirovibrionales bacterium]|nr:hypothetical protein [Vampirovibrionales bacterium]